MVKRAVFGPRGRGRERERERERGAIDKYACMYSMENGIPAIPAKREMGNPAAPKRPLDLEMFDPTYMEQPSFEIKDASDEWLDP